MQKDFPKSTLHCQKHNIWQMGTKKEREEREQKYQAVLNFSQSYTSKFFFFSLVT
jgi:hypothetical protein